MKQILVLLFLLITNMTYAAGIEIKWNKTEWADLYTVEIARDNNFINIVESKTIPDTKISLDLPLGKYYFHVCGINKYGLEGQFSKTELFTVTENNISKNKEFNVTLKSIPNTIKKIVIRNKIKPYYKINSKITTINSNKYLSISKLSKDVKNIYYAINSKKFIPYEDPFVLTKEGIYAVSYYGIDFVGNISHINTKLILIDNTPPIVKLKTSEKNFVLSEQKFINSNNLFTFYIYDNLSGVNSCYYSINNSKEKKWTGEYFNLVKNNRNIISYFAIDNSLNKTHVITNIYYVDNTPPKGDITLRGTFITKNSNTYIINNSTKIFISAEDNLSGIKNIIILLNGRKFIYTGSLKFLKGENKFQFIIEDNANNRAVSPEYIIIKDTCPPTNKLIKK